MADDFDKSGKQSFKKETNFVSFGESCRLEYKIDKQNRPMNLSNDASQKIDEYNKAKELIGRKIISSDESGDKVVRYTAMSNFKKRNV